MSKKKLLAMLMSVVMTLSLAVPALAVEDTAVTTSLEAEEGIVVLYTNDIHTYVDNGDEEEFGIRYSTVAALKDTYPNAILVDAGDHIQGTAYGSMDKGETIIELMNAAGYDLATLGNHEFDYGMEGCMNAIEWAEFPYVSSNFYHEKNGVVGENVLDPYKVFEVDGKKVAFVGITTPESFTKSTPAYFQDDEGNYIYGIAGGTDGAELYAAVQTAVDAAAKEADYVIALGHLGDDLASDPWNSEDVIANTTGLDAFIDGHSHSTVPMKEVTDKAGETVVLTQTGEYLGAVGKLVIAEDGTITTGLLTADELAGITPDAEVKAMEEAWITEIDTKLGEVIGYTDVVFDNYDANGNRLVRKQQTNTGAFAADALYYLFADMGLDVDVAIMNGGGVRNKAITGDISYKTCKEIHTFGNVACLQTITGQQLLDALEWGAKDVNAENSKENGGFLHVSGVSYTINVAIPSTVQKDEKGVWTGAPTGEYRVSDVLVWNNETGEYDELDLNATYNLAGYNYTLRDLGDGFAMFDGAVNVLDYVMEDYMVLANYVKSFPVDETTGLPTITAEDGYGALTGNDRVTIIPADVAPDAWYRDAVWFNYNGGVMKGTDKGFEPGAKVTRASVLQTLYNLGYEEGETTKTFADVEGKWYADAANWALSMDLVDGTEFGEDAVITRAEIAGLIANFCKMYGMTNEGYESEIAAAADYAAITAEDLEAMTFCHDFGIMTGNEKGELMPNGEVSRAEFAAINMRTVMSLIAWADLVG